MSDPSISGYPFMIKPGTDNVIVPRPDEPALDKDKSPSRRTYNKASVEVGSEWQKYPWLEVKYPLVVKSNDFFTSVERFRKKNRLKEGELRLYGQFLFGGITYKQTLEEAVLYKFGKYSVKQGDDLSWAPVKLALDYKGERVALSLSLEPIEWKTSQLYLDKGNKKPSEEEWLHRFEFAKTKAYAGLKFEKDGLRVRVGASGRFSVLVPIAKFGENNSLYDSLAEAVDKGLGNRKKREEKRQELDHGLNRLRFSGLAHPEITLSTYKKGSVQLLAGLGGFYEIDEINTTDSGKILPLELRTKSGEFPTEYYGNSARVQAQIALGKNVIVKTRMLGFFGNKIAIDSKTTVGFNIFGSKLGLFFRANYSQWGTGKCGCKITNTRITGGLETAIWWGDTQ